MGSHGLLEDHFDALQALLLVLELTTEDVVAELAVAAGLVSQVVEHAVGGHVFTVHFANVHETLLDGEELRLVELDHVGQLALFLRELGILLLLLSQLRGRLQESLKILLVALSLKQVDLGEQLLLLLLELGNLLFEVSGVHRLGAKTLYTHVSGLELSLQILINLEGVAHLIINEEFIGDGKRDQELGSVGFALQLTQPSYYPEQDVLNGALVTVHDVSHEVRVEV